MNSRRICATISRPYRKQVEPVAELLQRAHTVGSTILYIGMRRDIHSTQTYNQYNNSYEPYTNIILKTSELPFCIAAHAKILLLLEIQRNICPRGLLLKIGVKVCQSGPHQHAKRVTRTCPSSFSCPMTKKSSASLCVRVCMCICLRLCVYHHVRYLLCERVRVLVQTTRVLVSNVFLSSIRSDFKPGQFQLKFTESSC